MTCDKDGTAPMKRDDVAVHRPIEACDIFVILRVIHAGFFDDENVLIRMMSIGRSPWDTTSTEAFWMPKIETDPWKILE